MALLSNNVKVSLFPDNFKEQDATRASSVTVLEYGYCISRSINDYREAYGSSSGGIMTIKVRVGTRDNLKQYYERIHNTFTSPFSFIFNAVYDENGHLTDYDGAVIAEGYIVDIAENFERVSGRVGQQLSASGNVAMPEKSEQMALTFKLLLSKLEYIGEVNNLSLPLSR